MFSKIRPFWPLLLTISLAVGSSFYLQSQIASNQEEFTRWLARFGPYIIIVYALLLSVAIIIAPIGGLPLTLAVIALFGPAKALILSYLISSPVYLINFYLARRYGRPLVRRIVGQESLSKMDHLVRDAGLALLIITRVLQSGNFDYLSYAWGLTKISFKVFLVVNFLAGVPGALVGYLIFSLFDNIIHAIVVFYIVTLLTAGLAMYLTHFLRRHRFSLTR